MIDCWLAGWKDGRLAGWQEAAELGAEADNAAKFPGKVLGLQEMRGPCRFSSHLRI